MFWQFSVFLPAKRTLFLTKINTNQTQFAMSNKKSTNFQAYFTVGIIIVLYVVSYIIFDKVMGAPMIVGKVAFVLGIMTLALAIWLALLHASITEKCKDAGGVYVSGACINPAVIIEVN